MKQGGWSRVSNTCFSFLSVQFRPLCSGNRDPDDVGSLLPDPQFKKPSPSGEGKIDWGLEPLCRTVTYKIEDISTL